MSRETLTWLNENTLIGFTEKRGKAWHARRGADNHYVGPVPVDDVRKRLFTWKAVELPVYVGNTMHEKPTAYTEVPDRKAIVHPTTGKVFGIFNNDWQPHHYDEWLIQNVETILDDDLQIGTAGLLKGGGQAWVQVEVPETIAFAGGVRARPFLLAATALDGSLSSTYGAAVTNTVCDNTMAIAMGEHGGFRFKVRHSKNSLGRISDVREALGVIHTAVDDFGRQVEALLDAAVTDRDFLRLLDAEMPLPDAKKAPGPHATAVKKRDYIWDLYRFDERVAPWRGSALGVWQAFNTYQQHESVVRKDTVRAERNARRLVEGKQEKADLALLEKIMELAA